MEDFEEMVDCFFLVLIDAILWNLEGPFEDAFLGGWW